MVFEVFWGYYWTYMIYYGPNFDKDILPPNLTDEWADPEVSELYPKNLSVEEIKNEEEELTKRDAVVMKNIETMIAQCELDISNLEYYIKQIESLDKNDLATKQEISRKKAEIQELQEKILRFKEKQG